MSNNCHCVLIEISDHEVRYGAFECPCPPERGSSIELNYPDKPNENFSVVRCNWLVGGDKVRCYYVYVHRTRDG